MKSKAGRAVPDDWPGHGLKCAVCNVAITDPIYRVGRHKRGCPDGLFPWDDLEVEALTRGDGDAK